MSNSHSDSSFYIIGEQVIKHICPAELEAFNAALSECAEANTTEETEVTVDDVFADYSRQALSDNTDYFYPNKMSQVQQALASLQKAFSAATEGLIVRPGIYVDDGLPGSSLSEQPFWFIDNAMIPNPAFTKLVEKFGVAGWAQRRLDCAC